MRSIQRRDFLGLTLAATALPAMPARAQRGYDVTPLPKGLTPPPMQAMDMHGKTWALSGLRGRAVVLNFWATWCPPCRAEMPSLQQMAEIYGPEQLQVLAVNVGEGPRRINQYLQASGLNLTVLLDPQSEIARQWGASALPTTYLIDTQGNPRYRLRGEVDWTGREAAALVEPLLPKAGRPSRS
jgi:thiol-disulfide isomerase/thioredoxin